MEEKRYDVTALGELLIDFTQNALTEQGNPLFEANPGGAPCNVLAMLNKLGKKTAFIGKVGQDQFGVMLKGVLDELGIGTESLFLDEEVRTTLAFVHTAEDGDRDFAFYRNPGADMMLTEAEVTKEMVVNSRIFHFGTLSMTHEGVREATKKALRLAKENGILISFDPNLRPPLWKNLADAKEQILYGLGQCDVLKIADEELSFVTDCGTIEEGVAFLRREFPQIKLILVTMGKAGSWAFQGEEAVMAEPFLNPDTIETTGAGDTFCACILNYVLEHGLEQMSREGLLEMLTFANAASSIITTRRGALKVMPERAEVEAFIKTR